MQALIPDRLLCELNGLQQDILKKELPVLIIFEGSSGRVIGRVSNELIRCLEPRGVIYTHFDPEDTDGPRPIFDFVHRTPGKGQIGLFDRSWYSSAIERYSSDEKNKELETMLDMCNDLERYLAVNGVLLIKIIFRASGPALKEYGHQYGPAVPKRSFLSMDHIDPAKYTEVMFDRVYKKTNTEHSPWNQIKVKNLSETVLETVRTIVKVTKDRLASEPPVRSPPEIERIYDNPRGGSVPCLRCDQYEDTISKLSEELWELQMELSLSGRSVIICFEGWDASGKGSCIKHLCHALNPRGYEVFQTKAPSEEESKHTYLWRFGEGVPKKGRIAIYDRTWYGRMMVEPIEGFCTEEEYRRSPAEINALERMMANGGAILIKFWLDISPEEQLARFRKRENDPLKNWKITAEDWRNRSRWDEYSEHVDAMIESTNTEHAPWTVVASDNKKYARVKVLETVVGTLRKELKR